MTDAKDSAYPVALGGNTRNGQDDYVADGLTKREYMAAIITQAIVSSIDSEENYQRLKKIANTQNLKVSSWIARDAVKQADALIYELNNHKP